MRAILELKFLQRHGFKLNGIPECDLRLLNMETRHRICLTGIDSNKLDGPRSVCGAEITAYGSNRLTAVGGIITVDSIYYGLTVAYIFTDSTLRTE